MTDSAERDAAERDAAVVSTVSGHRAPTGEAGPASEAPEHDWAAAEPRVFPLLRPLGTRGTPLAELDADRIAAEGVKEHPYPLLDIGPAGLPLGYALRAGSFDVMVSADHLLAWGIAPADLRAAALANLDRWSEQAPWTDEASGHRRLVSSATGEGCDAVRIMVPACREHLREELGSIGRVLVGLPDRHLLVAGSLLEGDEEFAALFSGFVQEHSAGAEDPIDPRVFELVDDELRVFEG